MAARVLTEEDLEPLRRELAELRAMLGARAEPELTVEQASALLEVAPKTVRRWAREGRIQGRRRGREWRFARAGLARPASESPEAAGMAALRVMPRAKPAC